MVYFKIGTTDFSSYVSSLKVGYETLLSDKSGRNASGNNVIDVVNKKYKVYVTFKPLTRTEMSALMNKLDNYVMDISFMNPKTGNIVNNVNCYVSTPEPEFYRMISNSKMLYKPMSVNFIEN